MQRTNSDPLDPEKIPLLRETLQHVGRRLLEAAKAIEDAAPGELREFDLEMAAMLLDPVDDATAWHEPTDPTKHTGMQVERQLAAHGLITLQ